jgi:hypothetical protein
MSKELIKWSELSRKLSGGKNILKIHLQKFGNIKYRRIFDLSNKTQKFKNRKLWQF